ncbi:tetratricopeptide repeat protein [Natroniella sp. ANB-PHB2]|uniref:tetratricopeptide repeat protein n=1 Tax=Natroniella sp. ANB-PHB2 TaxID=3384444 RepID=UPI0038D5071C
MDCIKEQSAERDINNVNGTQIIIENVNLNENVKDKINKVESINYLNLLQNSFKNKKIVFRKSILEEIFNFINKEKYLVIYGEPGIGKTCILNQVSKKCESIYISLKEKSTLEVLQYLINKILLDKGDIGIKIKSEDEAFSRFEVLLQSTNKLFLLDDCEQNIRLINKLLAREGFENKFIFASRNKNIKSNSSISKYEIKPFSKGEVKKFLQVNNIEVNSIKVLELLEASKGNPLYLFFFSKYQIYPLPNGLEDYQEALWLSLNEIQRNILIIISIPLFPIEFEVLYKAISEVGQKELSPLKVSSEVDEISTLIKISDGFYELFHPVFDEFINDLLIDKGLMTYYKTKLGNIFLDREDYIEAINLLLDLEDEKIKPYLFSILPLLEQWGLWEFGIKVLNKSINLYNDDFTKGYSYYHLSNFYRLSNNKSKAESSTELAIKYANRTQDNNLLISAKMWKAMDLAYDLNEKEALLIVNEIEDSMSDSDDEIKAMLLANLSNIYIKLMKFEKGAKVAKQSYIISESLGDYKGLKVSLTNLTSCLVELYKLDLAIEYANILLDLAKNNNEIILEAVVLNTLTLCYRRKGITDEAKKACNRAIEICNKFKQKDRLAMNLINLGNVYRDEDDYNNAEKYYKEGYLFAKEIGFIKIEGQALELLANIYIAKEDYEKATSFAEEAIEKNIEIGNNYRVAESFIEKAKVKKLVALDKDSALAYENASKYYQKGGFWDKALSSLAESCRLWDSLKQKGKVNKIIDKLFIIAKNTGNYEGLVNLIQGFTNTLTHQDICCKIREIITLVVFDEKSNIVLSFLEFISYCKENGSQLCINTYRDINKLLIENLKEREQIANLLAISIEQSNYLINEDLLALYIDKLQEKLENFYYRKTIDDMVIFTFSLTNKVMFQIKAFSNLIEVKLALFLMLIIIFNQELFFSKIDKLREANYTISIINEEEVREHVQDISESYFEQGIPVVFLGRNDFDIFQPIIISNNYESMSCFQKNESTKVIIWFLTNLYQSIYGHFSHIQIDELDLKEARWLAETILQYDNVEHDWQVNNINDIMVNNHNISN